jgi:lipopolysaccharide/colanic/teichoic acid biosynthesis glycosyltransferase
MVLSWNRLSGRVVKRATDIAGAAIGIVLFMPLLLMLAVLIKADSPGPVFFRQGRVGRNGNPFRIWKLRTMVTGSEALGPGLTVASDERVTRVGRWLRRTKLDELPQLFNVLSGKMSLVGPRPEVPRYVASYSDTELMILEHRPGMTGPVALAYMEEESLLASVPDPERHYQDVVMREKIAMNLRYAHRATVFTDLHMIWRTVTALFVRERPPSGPLPASDQDPNKGRP